MRKILFLVSISLCFSLRLFAQDTLRVLQYNLLNFGNENSYCTNNTNNLSKKIAGIKTILSYAKPDIFSANEIGVDSTNYKIILDSILKPIYPSFKSVYYTNSSNADLVNMLYFKDDKMSLYSQKTIKTSVRDIKIYQFYYNSIPALNDTIFFTCIQAHLKAGNSSSDADERAQETKLIMDYLNSNNIGTNIILMGDFNLYSSGETAYQNLINHENANIRFYDPVYKSGSWSGNTTFAPYHTQSTRLTGNDCFASGGLNDRFDFILCSYPILAGMNKIAYIPSSYRTIGQDGNHLNKSVNYGTNTSISDSISEALYNVSDHLPIMLSLKIENQNSGITVHNIASFDMVQTDEFICLTTKSYKQESIQIEIFNTLGQEVYNTNFQSIKGNNSINIPISHFTKGIYLFKFQADYNSVGVKKFQIK